MRLPSLLLVACPILLCGAVPASASPEQIGVSGTLPDLSKLEVDSPHVYDYTFTTAPVDWRVGSGVWEMTNRWSCSPGWSWYGGRSDEVASIWNKRKVSGDVSAQMYFAFKMNMSGVGNWPDYPAEAAISICGDGKNLGTGYVFVAGAHDNDDSILMRDGVVVAESSAPEALLPRLTDGRLGNDAAHRRWWYSRIDKDGNRIECRLDGKLVLSYTDPAPIAGGQSSIWTYNNGIMLARVQIFYQHEGMAGYMGNTPVPSPAMTTGIKLAQVPASDGKM